MEDSHWAGLEFVYRSGSYCTRRLRSGLTEFNTKASDFGYRWDDRQDAAALHGDQGGRALAGCWGVCGVCVAGEIDLAHEQRFWTRNEKDEPFVGCRKHTGSERRRRDELGRRRPGSAGARCRGCEMMLEWWRCV